MRERGQRKTKRRRSRRRNPSSLARDAAWVFGGAAAFTLAAYGLHRATARFRQPKSPFDLPPPPQGSVGPGAVACEIGPNYPGFTRNDQGACVPTDATPPGIYVDAACQDFIFVAGDNGTQPDTLEALITDARDASLEAEAKSADPTDVVTVFLQQFWPACTWPPTSIQSNRMVMLFEALSFIVGRAIIDEGGRVLGTSSEDVVDEQVVQRLAELGLPPFEQAVVPEFNLSDIHDDDGLVIPGIVYPGIPPKPTGPFPQEPDPPMGGIDLPPGGQQIPSQGPDDPVTVYPVDFQPCQLTPYAPPPYVNISVEPARWTGPSTQEFLLLDYGLPARALCGGYNIRFGLCLTTTGGQIYGLLNRDQPSPYPLHLRNEDGATIDWSNFGQPASWKRQYAARARIKNGKVEAELLNAINDPGVDPCPDLDIMWPVASNGTFIVDVPPTGEFSPMQFKWKPRPKVTIVVRGKKIYAQLAYVGMPQFLLGGADPQWGGIAVPDEWEGDLVAARFQTTPMRAAYKVWALGT